jgi:hypothetical protein
VVNVRSPPVEWLIPLIKQLTSKRFGIGRSPLHHGIQKEKEVQLIGSFILRGTAWWQMMQHHPNKLPSFLPGWEFHETQSEFSFATELFVAMDALRAACDVIILWDMRACAALDVNSFSPTPPETKTMKI